jgi:hypothetical protein
MNTIEFTIKALITLTVIILLLRKLGSFNTLEDDVRTGRKRLKSTYYGGKKYTIEQVRLRNDEVWYQLTGMDVWVAKKDCTNGLTLFFYRFFNLFDK